MVGRKGHALTKMDGDALSDARTVTLRVWRGDAPLTVTADIKLKRQHFTKLYAKHDHTKTRAPPPNLQGDC